MLAYEGSENCDYPTRLKEREAKLGCPCVSVGCKAATSQKGELNVASSIGLSLESAFRLFEFAENHSLGTCELGIAFAQKEARMLGMPTEELQSDGSTRDFLASQKENVQCKSQPITGRFLSRMFASSKSSGVEQHAVSTSLTVSDFDLLRVVGKGAFGKVMLVRKKTRPNEGRIFAMKVLKKSVIAAKGQTEHTRSERSILCEVRHPYIVRLRYAFQSDEKLYLVTDYYNGGSLFYHLRKSRGFKEIQARFYAAELVLALDHLHSNGVIYR